MTVPDEILAPPDAYSRGFSRDDAALVLDGYLRRLASQETRCRTILGRLAREFLRQSGQHTLGFARIGDYAQEQLGMSGRELQSLAAVSDRLQSLPATCAAFAAGEVSWAQVRLLVTVAEPNSEAAWLQLARGRTVRALAALVREMGRPVPDESEEPEARFRLLCSARLRRLWSEVVELARRMAGSQLSQGQAAEVIAAEGLSARPADDETWPGTSAPPQKPADPNESRAAFPPCLDWNAVAEAIPGDVERLAENADHLEAFELDERMRAIVCARQRIDWQMGRLLRTFLDRRLFLPMQFPSAARYVQERLGISERKARALVALERKSWQAPGLGDAYRAGEVSWVRAQVVLPVLHEDTAAAWLTRARAVTVRRLADEVEWALVMRDGMAPINPPPAGASLAIDERQLCARPEWEPLEAEIAFRAPVSVVSLFRSAILAFARPADSLTGGLEALLLHVKATWEGQPRHRDPIFARDGWRCAVPACSSRRELHDHHVLFRSRGGDNARENRITVCAWHHLRGIHGGRVRAWGDAPDSITWELGVRAGAPPLLRLEGDRYLVSASNSPLST